MDAFELWCWRRLLWVPWTARRSNQSILTICKTLCSWRTSSLGWCHISSKRELQRSPPPAQLEPWPLHTSGHLGFCLHSVSDAPFQFCTCITHLRSFSEASLMYCGLLYRWAESSVGDSARSWGPCRGRGSGDCEVHLFSFGEPLSFLVCPAWQSRSPVPSEIHHRGHLG